MSKMSRIKDKGSLLVEADYSKLTKYVNNPMKLIMGTLALVVGGAGWSIIDKVRYAMWKFPEDICSVILFLGCGGLIIWVAMYQEKSKLERITLRDDYEIKLEHLRMSNLAKQTLMDLTKQSVDIIDMGDAAKMAAIDSVMKFLRKEYESGIDERFVKVEYELLKMAGVVAKLREVVVIKE